MMPTTTDVAKSALSKANQVSEQPAGDAVTNVLMENLLLPSLAIGSLPLALSVGAVLLFMKGVDSLGSSKERTAALNAAMPDEWLQQVAESKEASREGLAFLAKCISKDGVVTVWQAAQWAEIEEKQQARVEVQRASQAPGASALLARAQSECGSLLSTQILDSALDSIKKAGAQGAGFASRLANRWTTEKSSS
jgi:hypothetical protein